MLEENEVDDKSHDRAVILKRQKYSTWLYAFCLIGKPGKGSDGYARRSVLQFFIVTFVKIPWTMSFQ